MASLLKMTRGERAELSAAALKRIEDGRSSLDAELGPAYPEMGASVAKFRKIAAAAGSVSAMSRADRDAYAAAIERAIHAKNNAWWKAGLAAADAPCRDVGARIRAEHSRALAGALAASWAKRKPDAVESMYRAAMIEKAARAAAASSEPEFSKAVSAADAKAVAAIVKPAKKPVDWRAAGLKAAETRRRNLAAKAAAIGVAA